MSTEAPPHARVGTKYRTYKAATDELAKWLATTAKAVDKEGTLADVSKGVNRSHGLKIADFITLTNVIVEAVPKIEIPAKILSLARKAFEARQERAALLRGLDLASDKRHQHVIQVIGEVLDKLKGHGSAAKQISGLKANVDPKEGGPLAQSFQLLEVESIESGGEDEEDLADAPQAKPNKNKKDKLLKKKKKAKEASKHFHLEEEDEDPYFILMCLLSDLKMVREYIKELWQDYKDGRVDLITASLTTNASFDIVRTYEQDCPSTSSLLNNYAEALQLILKRNLDKADPGLSAMLDPISTLGGGEVVAEIEAVEKSLSSIPEVASLTFATATYFLNGPRRILVQKEKGRIVHLATCEEHPFGWYHPGEIRTTDRSIKEDIEILATFASCVFICNIDYTQFPLMHDHITMQWKYEYGYSDDKAITLSQAFGTQVCLDIYHTLGEHVEYGFTDFYNKSLQIRDTIAFWDKQTPQGPMKEIHGFEFLQKQIRLVQKVTSKAIDAMMYRQGEDDASVRFNKDNVPEGFTFYMHMNMNPLLCGITLFQITQSFREAGLNLAFQSGTVCCAGQFYFACQLHRQYWKSRTALDGEEAVTQRSLNAKWEEPLVWSDMDYFMKLVGVGAFFDGHTPESNRDLIMHQSSECDRRIAMGMQTNCSHANCGPIYDTPVRGEKGVLNFTKGRITTFEPIAITHRLLYSKYAVQAGQLKNRLYGWTMETLRALLEEQLDEEAIREKALKKKGKGKDKRWAAARAALMKGVDGSVSHVTILRTLREALEKESRALHFDILSFHVICFHLLTGLRSKFHQMIEDLHPIHVPDKEYFDNGQLKDWMHEIQVYINVPNIRKRKLLGPSDMPSRYLPLFTSQGQIDIDYHIRRFLQETEWCDVEVTKINNVHGIASA